MGFTLGLSEYLLEVFSKFPFGGFVVSSEVVNQVSSPAKLEPSVSGALHEFNVELLAVKVFILCLVQKVSC